MLEYDKTIEYILKAQNGDENAKTILIEENSPLVKSIVKRYKNKGVDYDDLYQLGCVGFLKAINNFDTAFEVKFSTYAVPMIAGEIKRFLRDDGSIKVSRSIKSMYYQMQKYIEKRKSEDNEIPTNKELSKVFNIEEAEIFFIMESSHMPVSLYEEIGKDGGEQTLIDKVGETESDEKLLNKLVVKDLLESLDSKDRKIIILRYFRDKTQSEVAQMLKVSQVQVSRLENKILSKLKTKLL